MLLFVFMSLFAQTQSEPYLWPIKGAKAGDNIISAPQSYFDEELNFSDLFIGAPEGTTVLSPADGIIRAISVGFSTSLIYLTSYSKCPGKNFDEMLKNSSEFNVQGGPKYLSGSLGINTKDGKTIWISGLSGSETFKTGQAIKRGEPIGRVAYSYFKIEEPSIKVSIDMNSRVSDPMTPFGIESSFRQAQPTKPIVSLTKTQAKEDFMIYINALKEAFPGLYDVVTPEELDDYVRQTIALIESYPGDLKAGFQEIIKGAVAKIHDSHIYLLSLPWTGESAPSSLKQSINFGWINDTLVCTNAVVKYKYLIGKQIKSVNGISADSIKKKVLSDAAVYDTKVESCKNYNLVFASSHYELGTDLVVEFAEKIQFAELSDTDLNGEITESKFVNFRGVDKEAEFSYSLNRFYNINKHKNSYQAKILDNSTAYIGLSNFDLNQVQVEEIGDFIKFISNIPNLIIDVRNNGGGHADVIDKLYSYIAGDTLTVDSYLRTNRRGGYESFKYSTNRMPGDDAIFADFMAEEGKEGFFQRLENAKMIVADPDINYKGRVYVLTNEMSTSAATLFPAMLVRNQRGVVVGRETRSAFHFMNALKFVHVRLPNSMIIINIPLVHCVFDTAVNERMPYGRGVLPDYPVPVTIDELSFENGDVILNYTLDLIVDGKYFTESSRDETKTSKVFLWTTLITVLLLVLGYLLYRHKRKH